MIIMITLFYTVKACYESSLVFSEQFWSTPAQPSSV